MQELSNNDTYLNPHRRHMIICLQNFKKELKRTLDFDLH